ncbi:penicillin-binding protein 1A [Caenimonas terrae]|uniref:Penicillin-binding protein 1A n=1 Tax=Caenimonas terrae TaxID=696074 RepID=A0ABW0NJU5_9BURK
MSTAFLDRARERAIALYNRLPEGHVRRAGILLSIIPLLVLLYVLALIPFTPSIGDIRKSKSEAPAVVMSADGKELAMFKRANRDWVKLADISPNVLAALVATEDRRFYEHHGMDFTRTLSAAVHTLSGDREGGSTITQQLARNLYPEEIGRSQTLTRKIKEAITALKIEAIYSKKEILETYLNTVPFLYNAYGIEMAARTYFDKSADKLDVLESATLIGMLKGTSYYNPVINPERATQRRNTVLAQMVKDKKLEPAQYEALKKQPLKIDFERQNEPLGPAPHLAQQLRRWLIDWADRKGYNIYTDGLVVRTTIDSRLQAMANQAVERQTTALQALADARRSPWSRDTLTAFIRESAPYKKARDEGRSDAEAIKQLQADSAFIQSLKDDKLRIQAGFLALDPRNGEVRAWVGSPDFAQDQFDHVYMARRQPGSTFKPFVYGAAFEAGARASDTFVDQAVEIPIDKGVVWRPSDGVPPSGKTMTLREGIAYSKNTITAQVMQKVGPQRVAALARAMGVRQSKLDPVMSLALGTSPVTLKEMVSSYGTIANGGNYIEPMVVLRIEDRHGKPLEEFRSAPPEPALSVGASLTLIDAMRGVVDIGTGMAIRSRYGIKADVAGKTGTTQDNTDGWFILMSPTLVAGAWAGFNDNRITMADSWGQGAHSALPMVGELFQQAIKAKLVDPALRFGAPPADPGGPDALGKMNDWFHNLFEQREAAQAALPASAAAPDTAAPEPEAQPRLATGAASVDTTVVPSEYQGSEIVRVMPGGGGATSGANGGFEIQQPRPVQRQIEVAPARNDRPEGPFVVGAPALGTPSIGSASGNAISVAPREDRREQRPEPAGEPPAQPARGSPSVRFESPPETPAPEPQR